MLCTPMPELPEVEITRKRCASYLRGRQIQHVEIEDDPIVFCGQNPETLRAGLEGQRIRACERRGKYFWWSFESQGALLLHLGMTGAVHVPNGPALKLSHGIDFAQTQWPPRFTKLALTLDNGQRLAFCDPRRFGRVQLQVDPLIQAPVSKLGPDPIAQGLAWDDFEKALSKRKGSIKGLLLNQQFIAGLGNWIADEVLYQARLHPQSIPSKLAVPERRALFVAIQEVLHQAVKVDADASRFPEYWLFHRRWNKRKDARDHQGHPVKFIEVAGRTTAWVPALQSDRRA